MSQSQQIKEITEQLEKGIKDLFESDNYKNYLKCMSRFNNYSLNNTILIYKQCPSAELVASFGTWKYYNRSILKGSKGIKIIAPCSYKKKVKTEITDTDGKKILGKDGKPLTEEVEKNFLSFKIANVFDISCTEGEPLPQIAHKLDGTDDDYNDLFEAIKQFSPVPIDFKTIEGSTNGYYHLIDKNIYIDNSMSQSMNCKTAIHELAHALLHDRDNGLEKDAHLDKSTKEVQAESIAYTVLQHFGNIDTSDYSFGYVAGWSSGKDLKELKASLEIIRQTAQTIINGIGQKLDAIKQSKQITMDDPILKNMDAPTISEPKHNRTIKH